MSRVILAASTSAGQSDEFPVRGPMRAGGDHVHLTAPGIAGSEVATVQKKNNDDTFSDYYVDGTIQTITATNTGVVIDGCGIYRIDKDATAASVGVEISRPDDL